MKFKLHMKKEGKRFLIFAVVISIIIPLVIFLNGFCNIEPMNFSDKSDLAKSIAAVSLPMSAILTFICGHALELHAKYNEEPLHISALANGYNFIGFVTIVTVISCVINGLISIQYAVSGVDIWLVSALFLLLFIFALLIFSALLFYIYATKPTWMFDDI